MALSIQGRQDKFFILEDNLTGTLETAHGPGDAHPMGAGQKAQVFMGQRELNHNSP